MISSLACFAPKIILIPTVSNLSSPIQFRRDEEFSISSAVELNCNSSVDIIIQWTIHTCIGSNCSNSIQVDSTVATTYNELFIPSGTLLRGLYQFKLTVTMVISPSLKSSQSAYIQIEPSGISANLFQFGTSMIANGYQQDLQLNPGLYSIDQDGYDFNASVNSFLI